ncbi:UNVERIFIED_CONTAM: hypothetical protein K2H54_047823 [Gekko kuhli]
MSCGCGGITADPAQPNGHLRQSSMDYPVAECPGHHRELPAEGNPNDEATAQKPHPDAQLTQEKAKAGEEDIGAARRKRGSSAALQDDGRGAEVAPGEWGRWQQQVTAAG